MTRSNSAASRSRSPLSNAPVGVFDSGLGGLTVLRAIHKLLPREDLVYLGDTARVPYGTKSPQTVVRFAGEDASFLCSQHVKAIVVACNTASAWSIPGLRSSLEVPVIGVIEPGAKTAAAATRNGVIGVIGTRATIKSRAYPDAIHTHRPEARVLARATPLLVPLVEEGWTSHAVMIGVLEEYLRPMIGAGIDTLVLGCTHYPLLKTALRKALGRGVRLVDSAESCARALEQTLVDHDLVARRRGGGTIRPFVTDEPERFGDFARRFLKTETEAPVKVDLT